MKPFTDEQLETLKNEYVIAAAELVATKGWPALAVRNVGEKVGKSGNAIHRQFKGSALKCELIRHAFGQLIFALQIYEVKQLPYSLPPRELIEAYLLRDGIAAPLMAQVVSLVAAREADDAEELSGAFKESREGVRRYLDEISSKLWPNLTRAAQEREASDLVEWFITQCVTIVTHLVSIDGNPVGAADCPAS